MPKQNLTGRPLWEQRARQLQRYHHAVNADNSPANPHRRLATAADLARAALLQPDYEHGGEADEPGELKWPTEWSNPASLRGCLNRPEWKAFPTTARAAHNGVPLSASSDDCRPQAEWQERDAEPPPPPPPSPPPPRPTPPPPPILGPNANPKDKEPRTVDALSGDGTGDFVYSITGPRAGGEQRYGPERNPSAASAAAAPSAESDDAFSLERRLEGLQVSSSRDNDEDDNDTAALPGCQTTASTHLPGQRHQQQQQRQQQQANLVRVGRPTTIPTPSSPSSSRLPHRGISIAGVDDRLFRQDQQPRDWTWDRFDQNRGQASSFHAPGGTPRETWQQQHVRPGDGNERLKEKTRHVFSQASKPVGFGQEDLRDFLRYWKRKRGAQ
ncbi:hypothetical protein ColTof4_01140 [Colletotrichum tofieldiae]|nr:hypothetical protein ColTof3_08366 [Colletotrichum tofieldiae]GKT68717.1 hypothetical protein ColTof4_01140 [Colletotrichum tofieldiae]